MRTLSIFILILAFPQAALSDCQPTTTKIRKCFDHRNAPPDMVFQVLAHRAFSSSIDYLEDLSQIEDEPGHAGWNAVKNGLTPNMSSTDVVRYLVRKYIEMEDEVNRAQQRTLCVDGVPRYNGKENAVIWNQLDEVAQNIYQMHYFLARADLQASGLYDLDKAISDSSISFTIMYMDHSFDSWGSVDRLYEAAKMFCASPGGISVQH